MADILPSWVMMCRKGILSLTLPREKELCPLFVVMRDYIQHPDKPVSWSVTFAVHAMLTSVLETQLISNELTTLAKGIFNQYLDNIDWAYEVQKNESTCGETLSWTNNILCIKFLRNFGLPLFGDRSMWNPLCGGTTLSYICFSANLEAGCTVIDGLAQLRIVLHLYHGLLVNGILTRDELPPLDMLYGSFKSCKAIWEGPLPRRGELVQRWWICFGASVSEAKQLADESRVAVQQRRIDASTSKRRRSGRTLTAIEPAQLATSYRRLCHRDFHDVVDKYHTQEQRQRNKGSDQYRFAVRTNDTLDALDREQTFLAFNLTTCGTIMDQFVCSLGRILQWEPLLHAAAGNDLFLENTQRQGFVYLFAQHLLGALDFAGDPFKHAFLNVPMGEASSHFMRIFFSSVDPARMLWFTPVQEEGE